MTLLIEKLEKIIAEKGYKIIKYLISQQSCFLIHVIHLVDYTELLIYITSEYDFKMNEGHNTYSIDEINLNENKTKEVENMTESQYEKITPNINTDKDIENELDKGYISAITINDFETLDDITKKEVNDIYIQLSRLKNCVSEIKYKLSILHKNYICLIRRNNDVECYVINNLSNKKCNQLVVVIDVETFYEYTTEKIKDNTLNVLNSIFNVLNKNQELQEKLLKKFLEEKNDCIKYTQHIKKKTDKYTNYIIELECMLTISQESETKILDCITNINLKHNNVSIKGLHKDIEKTHEVAKQEKELEKIQKIKNDIITTIEEIKSNRDETLLKNDNILFNNIVFFNKISNNLQNIKKISF